MTDQLTEKIKKLIWILLKFLLQFLIILAMKVAETSKKSS